MRFGVLSAVVAVSGWVSDFAVAQPFDCEGVEAVSGTNITLELVADGLAQPVDVVAPPGDTERIFVVEQAGTIRIIKIDQPDDVVVPQPFLDVEGKVRPGGERGLLGLAFHPDYAANGFFYVYYTRSAGAVCASAPPPGCPGSADSETVVARYRVSAGDPDVADPNSEEVVLTFCQPFGNHNAGHIEFGPHDGYLYIATGDGGSGGDPCNSGQRTNTFLGKILRIDVDSGSPYSIPPDNPFVGVPEVFPEIWALGLRNPWRFAFDAGAPDGTSRGDLYIADVGQGEWEEVDYQPGSSAGGENYEWRRREGDHDFSLGTTLTVGSPTGPIYEYPLGGGVFRGCSVTGGEVYRGCRLPDLHGTYFFADYCNDWVGTFRVEGGAAVGPEDRTADLNDGILPDRVDDIAGFGLDGRGEMYICDLSTKIFRVVGAPTTNNPPNARVAPDPDPAVVSLIGGSAQVTLDGSSSDDGDGGTQGLTYAWTKVSGPDGFLLATPASASTAVTFTEAGGYTFRLTVDDGQDSDSDEVLVSVMESETPFRRGDVNADGRVDISDGVFLLLFLFAGGPPPGCDDAADANDDGTAEMADAIFLFSFLFLGAEPPPSPGVAVCGVDGTSEDPLGCAGQPPCEG